jgi:hypothetical protein
MNLSGANCGKFMAPNFPWYEKLVVQTLARTTQVAIDFSARPKLCLKCRWP